MAKKKVVGEDGKTYTVKVKKPFYKRVWFWILIIIVVAGIGGALGGGGSDDDKSADKSSDTKTSQSESSKASSSSKKDDGKITRAQFDAIKIGDLMSSGQGGSTLDDLTKQFGKPSDTSSSEDNGVKTDIDTWTNVVGGWGANVIVTFTDGNAVAKNLTGFKLSRKQKISLADFNAFANGLKYTDFTAKWGQPDYYDETLIDGTTTIIAGYTSGVKGDFGANFNVTFENGALTAKTQSSMK
jgi:hypothetical protein